MAQLSCAVLWSCTLTMEYTIPSLYPCICGIQEGVLCVREIQKGFNLFKMNHNQASQEYCIFCWVCIHGNSTKPQVDFSLQLFTTLIPRPRLPCSPVPPVPTSPCPALSAGAEPKFQGHCQKWHHKLKVIRPLSSLSILSIHSLYPVYHIIG